MRFTLLILTALLFAYTVTYAQKPNTETPSLNTAIGVSVHTESDETSPTSEVLIDCEVPEDAVAIQFSGVELIETLKNLPGLKFKHLKPIVIISDQYCFFVAAFQQLKRTPFMRTNKTAFC